MTLARLFWFLNARRKYREVLPSNGRIFRSSDSNGWGSFFLLRHGYQYFFTALGNSNEANHDDVAEFQHPDFKVIKAALKTASSKQNYEPWLRKVLGRHKL